MPRYYCDYCDAYLTHDSMAGRQQHMRGWKHRENYRNYYQQFYPQWALQHSAYLQTQGIMPMPVGMPMHGMPGMPPPQFMPPMGMPPPSADSHQAALMAGIQSLPLPPGVHNPPPMFRPPPSFAPPPAAHSST